MSYTYKEVLVSSLERRDKNMDTIFFLQDKMNRIEREYQNDLKSRQLENKDSLTKIKDFQIKDLINKINLIQEDNKTIDAQILEKWMKRNG